MAMVDEFRAMTQDIAASFDVRKAEFASMRQQISDTLRDFRKTRLHDAKGYEADRKRTVSDIKNEISGLLGGFRKDREEMASAWHDLAASKRAKSGGKPRHTAKKSQPPHKKRAEAGA